MFPNYVFGALVLLVTAGLMMSDYTTTYTTRIPGRTFQVTQTCTTYAVQIPEWFGLRTVHRNSIECK